MLQNPKFSHPSPKLILHPPPEPPHLHRNPASPPPSLARELKLSRRELTLRSTFLISSLSLTPLFVPRKAQAEENPRPGNGSTSVSPGCGTFKTTTKKAFLDVSIDGEPAGRIIVGLYGDDVPAGTARFSSLVSGAGGISYRRKEFIKIMPSYVQHGGVRSYGVDAERAGNKLGRLENLIEEWERRKDTCGETTTTMTTTRRNVAGTVGIVVRDPSRPPPKLKLVARKGKLEIEEEEVATGPNGTEFVISIRDSPELDDSSLVVGRVLEGMEVVEKIGQVKTVQDNTGSPYFRVAKLIGDKRAVVAERGFNRPYSKVIVTNCGLID